MTIKTYSIATKKNLYYATLTSSPSNVKKSLVQSSRDVLFQFKKVSYKIIQDCTTSIPKKECKYNYFIP